MLLLSLGALTREVKAQDFKGIALIKPYPHSKDTEITEAIMYDSHLVGPIQSTFELNQVKKVIESSRIVKVYTISNPDQILNIISETDLKDIKLSIPRIEYVLKQLKLSEKLITALNDRLTSLKICVKNYGENQIRRDGIWLDKAKYLADENAKKERKILEDQRLEKLHEEEKRKQEADAKKIAEEVRLKNEENEKQRLNSIKDFILKVRNKILVTKNATFDDILSFCNFIFKNTKNEEELLASIYLALDLIDESHGISNGVAYAILRFPPVIYDARTEQYHKLVICKYTTVNVLYNMTVEQSMSYSAAGANRNISERYPIGSQTEIEYSIKAYNILGNCVNDSDFARYIIKN